eukprot:1162121-Pelagomonas_calceolata.AAC.5
MQISTVSGVCAATNSVYTQPEVYEHMGSAKPTHSTSYDAVAPCGAAAESNTGNQDNKSFYPPL